MGYFKQFQQGKGVEFMDNRERGIIRDLVGHPVKVDEFAFIHTKNGKCAVFTVQGIDNRFWFAPTAVSDMMAQVMADGMEAEFRNVLLTIEERISKAGNLYFGYTITE